VYALIPLTENVFKLQVDIQICQGDGQFIGNGLRDGCTEATCHRPLGKTSCIARRELVAAVRQIRKDLRTVGSVSSATPTDQLPRPTTGAHGVGAIQVEIATVAPNVGPTHLDSRMLKIPCLSKRWSKKKPL